MVSLGAVVVEPKCTDCGDRQRVWDNGDTTDCRCVVVPIEPDPRRTFYAQFKPISENWIPEALAVSGHTREECLTFPDAKYSMARFKNWLDEIGGKPRFVSDNNGFDWQFVNYYFHAQLDQNPFGYSSTNLGSLYKGMVKNVRENFKHLRKTKHTHHPVDDSKGNVEAMVQMRAMGLEIEW